MHDRFWDKILDCTSDNVEIGGNQFTYKTTKTKVPNESPLFVCLCTYVLIPLPSCPFLQDGYALPSPRKEGGVNYEGDEKEGWLTG